MRWPPLRLRREPEGERLTELEAHRRGYLRAIWADEHDQAEYHWRQIELIERGLV